MKKNILLTCFGSGLFREFFLDFQRREDIGLFVSDVNPNSKVKFLSDQFLPVLPADDENFCTDLIEKAQANNIRMIIPGGDEEAHAMMRSKKLFEEAGIIAAVQDLRWLPILQSKSKLYDYLRAQGFATPRYQPFRTREEFTNVLEKFEYPKRPLLIKPNFSRGGRGVTLLSEKVVAAKDPIPILDTRLFLSLLDNQTEFLAMEYMEGILYDVDVLTYKDGKKFFGVRKRFHNLSQLFSGNIFEKKEAVLDSAEKLFEVLPTEYLVDYDFLVRENGEPCLLEINPRPSGSTISYLPFGINLYYILAKSYLDEESIAVDDGFYGQCAVTFHKMIKGKSQ